MSEIAPFLSPLPSGSSLQHNVNGRVRLPSLIPAFPFEAQPPLSISTSLPPLQQKDEDAHELNLTNNNNTSNPIQITNYSTLTSPPTELPNNPAVNNLNINSNLNIPQQRQILSFPRQTENPIYNIMTNNKAVISPLQNNIIVESPINNTALAVNFQNYGNIQTLPQQVQQQIIIRSPAEQFAAPSASNYSNQVINNNQVYMNVNQSNSIIIPQQQPLRLKLQEQQPTYQYYSPINSNIVKQPINNNSIDYSLPQNINNTNFFMNGMKPQNQFKAPPTNIIYSKVPIYSFRMRSGRRFSEKELLDISINPIELNFLPKEFWLTPQTTIKQVIETFFKARSTKNLRFEHKLWNALILSTHYPKLISVLGIYWISIDILKVNRDIFGALINVTKPAAALFNSQGSFLTHGFVEVSKEEALKIHMIKDELVEDVDESVVRLFRHSAGLLKANSHKGDLVTCRWNK